MWHQGENECRYNGNSYICKWYFNSFCRRLWVLISWLKFEIHHKFTYKYTWRMALTEHFVKWFYTLSCMYTWLDILFIYYFRAYVFMYLSGMRVLERYEVDDDFCVSLEELMLLGFMSLFLSSLASLFWGICINSSFYNQHSNLCKDNTLVRFSKISWILSPHDRFAQMMNCSEDHICGKARQCWLYGSQWRQISSSLT